MRPALPGTRRRPVLTGQRRAASLQLEGQNKVLSTALDQITESNRRLKEDLEPSVRLGDLVE